MNITELKTAFRGALRPDFSKFSQADADEVVRKGIEEIFKLENATPREIRARQPEIFALIEEVVEELLPKAIEDIMGGFTEVKTFARDAEPIFLIKGIGKSRARMSITEGARGGVYKARRLDNKNFQVTMKTETVSVFVTLEEILLGTQSLGDLMSNIRDGFAERIYIKAVQALRTAKTLAPSSNIASGNGIEAEKLDELIRITSAYGTPIIMGFRSAVTKITNMSAISGITPNVSLEDLNNIRSKGFVDIYKGVPVVELPNYLVDETNSEFVFKEGDLFILPTDARPIKVAMKGDLHIQENTHPTGSKEQQAHRMIGVGLYLTNNVCVYTDNEISGGLY